MAFPSDWEYYRSVDISENQGSLTETSTVRVEFDSATPISEGKLESDLKDLRIGDGNGNEVPFIVEQDSANTTNTVIHIFVDSIQSSGNLNYKIWYGNSSASRHSEKYLMWIDIEEFSGTWGGFSSGNSLVRGQEVMSGTQARQDGSDSFASSTKSLEKGSSGQNLYVYPHWITDEGSTHYIKVRLDGTTKSGPSYNADNRGGSISVIDEFNFTIGSDEEIKLDVVPIADAPYGASQSHVDGVFISFSQISAWPVDAMATNNPHKKFFDQNRLSAVVGAEEKPTTLATASRTSASATPQEANGFSRVTATIDVTIGVENVFSDGFENDNTGNFPSNWSQVDSFTTLSVTNNYAAEGSQSFHIDGSGAVAAEKVIQDEQKPDKLVFWYRETTNSTGQGMSIVDTDGTRIFFVGVDNPELQVYSGNGWEYSGNGGPSPFSVSYDDWRKFTITVDRSNDQFSVDWYSTNDNTTYSYGPFPLNSTNDVDKLQIENYNNQTFGGSDTVSWFDGIDYDGFLTGTGRTKATTSIQNAVGRNAIFSQVERTNAQTTVQPATAGIGNTASTINPHAQTTIQDTDVYSVSTGVASRTEVNTFPQVASTSIIKSPPIKYHKPRARVRVIDSNTGEESTIISTKDGSDNYLNGDIDVDGTINNAVSTAAFSLTNPNDRFGYLNSDDELIIELGYNTPLVTVFRGIITKPNKTFSDSGSMIDIEAKDFGAVLQDEKAAEVYIRENMGFILRDLVKKYAPELDPSGIQGPGIKIRQKKIAYESLFSVFEDFAERAGYQFYVDNDKVVHFEPQGFEAAQNRFEEGGLLMSFESQPNREKLINEAIIFGGKQSSRRIERKDADASTKVFKVAFKPNDPNVTVNGVDFDGGVEGTTNLDDSDVDYVYDKETREFIFDEPPTGGENAIEINYSRSIPIQAIVRDEESINEYGKKQYLDTDQNLGKQSEAKDIAQSLVNNFSEPPEEATADIVAVHELKPGQTATFDIPSMGINDEEYDIVSVNYTWGESGYQMSMDLNEERRKLKDVLKSMKKDIQRTKGHDSGITDLVLVNKIYEDAASAAEDLSVESRDINDSAISGHPNDLNSESGTVKSGDRRGSYNQIVDE